MLLREDLVRCFAADPTERFGSAAELAKSLRALPDRRTALAAQQAELAVRERAAYKRGVMRTLGTAAGIVGLLLFLAINNFVQARKAAISGAAASREGVRADAQARKAAENEQNSRRLLYASDMNLAQQSLKLNNLGKARRLLDRHRPEPGQEDLRGWEWRYLWQLTRSSALGTLTNRPTTRGWSVSFSPDGTRLAAGWLDGRVDLRDVPGRRLVRALTDREQHHQGHVAFSPVRNLLAATSEPKVVTLYNLDSGQESIFWRASDRGDWRVRNLSFSQDGSKLVIYARSGSDELGDEVSVVNVSSSKIESRHKIVSGYSLHGFLGAAQLSPDNRRLYMTRQYSIQCLDLATGQKLWETEPEQAFGMTSLALSPDGRVLASSSGYKDPTICVSDAATGQRLKRLEGHTGWVCKVVFSKDGRHLISAATDQTIRFGDASTWTEKSVLRGHINEIHTVAFAESAQLVASAAKDGNLTLWREDGNYLSTEGQDTLRPWNVETGQIVVSIYAKIGRATIAAGGRVLVALIEKGNNSEIEFYDLAHPGPAPSHFPGILHLASLTVSPDGELVAAIDNGQVRLYDPAKGESIEPPLHGHLNPVYGIAFSPDGRRLLSASGSREAVKLWDVGTRQELLTLGGTGSMLWTAQWSADGDLILVGPPWQTWHAPSREEIAAAESNEKKETKQP
ncbi:MAG: hypothetical protein EXS36_06665 [Pedosphaera sp.]|nr:hypothetical protein [Pedosphaera sp.]